MEWLSEPADFNDLVHEANDFLFNRPAFELLVHHLRRSKHERIVRLTRSLLKEFPVYQMTDFERLDRFAARLAVVSIAAIACSNHATEVRFRINMSMYSIAVEFQRLNAVEHQRMTRVWRSQFEAYARAMIALSCVSGENPGSQLAVLSERIIVASVYLHQHLEILLDILDEQMSAAKKNRCKELLRNGIEFGKQFPWSPQLSSDDIRGGVDDLLDDRLPRSAPAELAAVYSRVEFRRMKPLLPDEKIGFLNPLTKNPHFERAVRATGRAIDSW